MEAALGMDEELPGTDDTGGEEEQPGGRRRLSITTGLLPDKMLSGEILTAPASLSDFASAPVRETIPYTADPKTAMRRRAREMAKLYGEEEDGPYVNFVVHPGRILAAFYPREAHLLGESVYAMIGDRGGKNYIWCERALSECHIVVIMDGEVRADMAQAQQNAGQEVRQWLFTMRRHLSQSSAAQSSATGSGADNAPESTLGKASAQPQMPKLFLRNISLAELGISGSTAAQVELLDHDILEWCWDHTSHLYPLLPVQRALRLVFHRERRVLRSVVFNTAGVILLLSGVLYAYTTIYQFFQQREIAQQVAAAQQSRNLLADEVVTDAATEVAVAEPLVDRQIELVDQQLEEFIANQRDAGTLFDWVLQGVLDLGSYVNSDPSRGDYSFYRLMQHATWTTAEQQLTVHIAGSVGRVTRLYQMVSEEPDFTFSVRAYSTRRGGGKLTLQRSLANAVPRLNEWWLPSQSAQPTPVDTGADIDDFTSSDADDLEMLLANNSGFATADETDSSSGLDNDSGAVLEHGTQALPERPQRQRWLLREWVLLLGSMNAKNIKLYEEQRRHYRLYEVWADLPPISFDAWRWFGQLLKNRDVLLRYLDMSFSEDGPQRIQAHVRLGIALPLRSGEALRQDPKMSIAPLPKESGLATFATDDDALRAGRGRQRGVRR